MNYENLYTPQYEEISFRLELLFWCLGKCSQNQEEGRGRKFTVGERILINQERGALMSQQTFLLYNDDTQLRYYQVPQSIEDKIQFIKSKL